MAGTSTSSERIEEDSIHVGVLLGLLVAAFAYRAAWIHLFPTVYSWDAFTRLLDPSRILVRHWLPVPQLPIFLTDLAGGDIVVLRLVYAAIGAVGAVLVGWYSLRVQGRQAGLVTILLASTLPGFVIFTLVPYQEGALVLFLFAFLCLWTSEAGERSSTVRLIAAASLALACLCRYEAWIFAVIFALRPVVDRRWRDLWIFAPSAVAMVWWLLTLPALDVANPMAVPPPSDPSGAADPAWVIVAETIRLCVEELYFVGLPLAVVGAVAASRRGGLFGHEMVVFWIALFAMAVYRAIHTSLPTERMAILPLMVATLYVPKGLLALAELCPISARAQRIACGTFLAVLVLVSGFSVRDGLDYRARRYGHERAAALFLEELVSGRDRDLRVGIVPRPTKNRWGETFFKAIFGQSMMLRPDDPHWVLGRERVQQELEGLDQILVYDTEADRYRSVRPQALRRSWGASDPLAAAQGR